MQYTYSVHDPAIRKYPAALMQRESPVGDGGGGGGEVEGGGRGGSQPGGESKPHP